MREALVRIDDRDFAVLGIEELVETARSAGIPMTLTGPQDAIAGAVDGYEAEGVAPELRKLSGYDGGGHPLGELTDRQREVVETAYEAGYYEVPRTASTEAVADELGLDPSTVAEHLQRAERNLMAHHLDGA